MKKIFVVNGLPESGKTTFGKIVGKELEGMGINFLHASSIDPVKQILLPEDKWELEMKEGIVGTVLKLFKSQVVSEDWDGITKNDYWRKAMSDLKYKITEWNPYLIPNLVISKIRALPEPFVAFVDIREPENIKVFGEACRNSSLFVKIKTILVESDRSKRSNNRSDESVYETEYDYVIKNPGKTFDGQQEISLQILTERARKFIDIAVLDTRRSIEIV